MVAAKLLVVLAVTTEVEFGSVEERPSVRPESRGLLGRGQAGHHRHTHHQQVHPANYSIQSSSPAWIHNILGDGWTATGVVTAAPPPRKTA